MTPLNPGISTSGSAITAQLTEPIVVFMNDLRASLSPDIPLLITSGMRGTESQARAMAKKVELGEDLRLIYADDFADAVMLHYPDIPKMAMVISRFAAVGRGSSHLKGNAVDLRSWDKSMDENMVVIAAARSLGASAIYETTPAHVHITIPVGYKGTAPVDPGFDIGNDYVDKDGPGGWRYRQWSDGMIQIIGAPPGNSTGAFFVPGSDVHAQVTAEIGPYQPTMLASFPWPMLVIGVFAAGVFAKERLK